MTSGLLALVRTYGTVPADDAARIEAAWSAPEAVDAGTVLLAPGHTCRTLFFLEAGYARFYAEPDGRDVTRHLVPPGTLFTVYPSLDGGVPATEGLQTLTAAHVRRVSREAYDRLVAASPAYAAFRRAYVRDVYAYLDRALDAARWQTAAERYAAFERETPDLLLHVPLHTVASYLGMTPQSLSRVRARHR